MIAALYTLAPWAYCATLVLIGGAIMAGWSADHAGTRRIALVMLAVTASFIIAPMLTDWSDVDAVTHIVANGLAVWPLLRRPKTSRHQMIAAWYFANALIHSGFYFLVPDTPTSAIIEWYGSISIDALQAVLVLWWSWPHVRKMVGRHVRRRDGSVRPATTFRVR